MKTKYGIENVHDKNKFYAIGLIGATLRFEQIINCFKVVLSDTFLTFSLNFSFNNKARGKK